jgi:hypothetical protein
VTRLVLLPGLGTTGQLLEPQQRDFPHLEVPPWLEPHDGETLPAYGRRMAASLGGSGPDLVLGGVSFGGMVAFEMARHVSTRCVVLIASCATGRALTRVGSLLARVGRGLPGRDLSAPRPLWPVLAWAFGARTTKLAVPPCGIGFELWAPLAARSQPRPRHRHRVHLGEEGERDARPHHHADPPGAPQEAGQDGGYDRAEILA